MIVLSEENILSATDHIVLRGDTTTHELVKERIAQFRADPETSSSVGAIMAKLPSYGTAMVYDDGQVRPASEADFRPGGPPAVLTIMFTDALYAYQDSQGQDPTAMINPDFIEAWKHLSSIAASYSPRGSY